MPEPSSELQGIIAQMLRPLKNLPFGTVIESLSGHRVIPFDKNDPKDMKVLANLQKAADITMKEVNKEGIKRSRPNEVGNDIEPFVKAALQKVSYEADTPTTNSGKKKATGYPDIEFKDDTGRVHYLECKTFDKKNETTTQRSFYLSPSHNFKVTKDAHHFGISFEIYVEGEEDGKHIYKIKGWKILDLSHLRLDVKYEFNADNKRLYQKELILAQK